MSKRKQEYAKPGTPPPSQEEIDKAAAAVSAAVLALDEARYEQRIALANRDLLRAKARAARAEVERLQRQLARERAKAGS